MYPPAYLHIIKIGIKYLSKTCLNYKNGNVWRNGLPCICYSEQVFVFYMCNQQKRVGMVSTNNM